MIPPPRSDVPIAIRVIAPVALYLLFFFVCFHAFPALGGFAGLPWIVLLGETGTVALAACLLALGWLSFLGARRGRPLAPFFASAFRGVAVCFGVGFVLAVARHDLEMVGLGAAPSGLWIQFQIVVLGIGPAVSRQPGKRRNRRASRPPRRDAPRVPDSRPVAPEAPCGD